MKINYGIKDNMIDVTDICLTKLKNKDIITIPRGDHNRANYFTDPVHGKKKSIFIEMNNKTTEYQYNVEIKINVTTNTVSVTTNTVANATNIVDSKLSNIHSNLKLKHGSFREELPEQKMAVRYLKGHEKVLEIGANIGRNTLVIASILNDDTNLVSLESDLNISNKLIENKKINNMNFHIEASALSKRKLIQKAWNTKPSDKLEPGYKWVSTISLEDLRKKYQIEFDTLVLDCEGAFYYILMDMPDILNNINLIIMENDYHDISKKNYIDDILKKNNFYVDYTQSGGWGPCKNNFFEVWKNKTSQ